MIDLFDEMDLPISDNPVSEARTSDDVSADSQPAVDDTPITQTASLKEGLTFGTSIPPYDGTTAPDRMGKPEAENFSLFGQNMFGDDVLPPSSGKLSERFKIPPFSVLSARDGIWQDRKRAWLALGIESEVGRGDKLMYASQDRLNEIMRDKAAPGGSKMPAADYSRGERGDGRGRPVKGLTWSGKAAEFDGYLVLEGTRDDTQISGTSIFDPVLCEMAYTWFCPSAGHILDPFAGGSVRGVVASKLGKTYTGIDLRPEQIDANNVQAARICQSAQPRWITGDSTDLLSFGIAPVDFVFSCPPYGDLEQYSDDPRDLSTMEFPAFLDAYRRIIAASVTLLKADRFAVFVVGDFRDNKGLYRNFVSETIAAFKAAGADFYNDAILVTAVGSLPIRAGRQFDSGRKLGKTHQNILGFVKGDPKRAAEACNGQIDLPNV